MFPSEINQIFLSVSSFDLKYSLAICLILCLLFSYPAVKRKWLTVPAMITTTIIALGLTLKLGLGILIFPFIFAFIGSLLSKNENQSKERNGRTTIQVFANAAPAIILILIFHNHHIAIPLVIFVFAIALADTMSSEIGKKYNGNNYDICTLKKMDHGLSGGVSLAGNLGGLAGSMIIGIAAMLYSLDFYFFISVCLVGFGGMLIDSVIGSLAQGKYSINNRIQEEGPKKNLVKGFHFFNNELTNFVSILFTIAIVYLLCKP